MATTIPMFRDKNRWDGWRQFDSPQHEQNTREDGRYEIADFMPITQEEAAWGVEALRQQILESGEAAPAEEALYQRLSAICNTPDTEASS